MTEYMFSMLTLQPIKLPSILPTPSQTNLAFKTVAGRLCEISGQHNQAQMSLAFRLILEAQTQGEQVAWISLTKSTFFPPDAQAHNVDLESLVVIRVPDCRAIARCADKLARSSAFGLILLDLEQTSQLSSPIVSRLNQLCQKHQTAILCLTQKETNQASISPLVSLRVSAQRIQHAPFSYTCTAQILKDKKGGTGQNFKVNHRSLPGLP